MSIGFFVLYVSSTISEAALYEAQKTPRIRTNTESECIE